MVRGNVWRARGKYDRALAEYGAAIELAPDYAYAYANRGYARFDIGDIAGAFPDLARAARAQVDAHVGLWLYLAQARAGKEVAADWSTYGTRFPKEHWSAIVAEMFLGRRMPADVLLAMRKPDDPCNAHVYVGEWLLLRKQRQAALVSLRSVRDSCPHGFIVYQGAVAELARLEQ